jgi:hypothetical protein
MADVVDLATLQGLAARWRKGKTPGHTFAGAPPGSGKNFAALKSSLAARGARNPGALAGWIGRRKYGRAGMAALSAAGRKRHSAGRAVAASNTGQALEFSMTQRLLPVTSPGDLIITRNPASGVAVIRHARGGALIGEIRRGDQGWVAVRDGKASDPRPRQNAALAGLIGGWNRDASNWHAAGTPQPAVAPALQPPPAQTPLMQQFGVPAVRAFSTPAAGAGSGARVVLANGDTPDSGGGGGEDLSGLSPRGVGIYRKLRAKGFPAPRALKFARRAQSFGGGGK